METAFGPVRILFGDNRGKYPNCHTIYVEADTRVVIDPGCNRDVLSGLLKGPGVDAVWLTHVHEDHITHLDLFMDRPLWVSEKEAPAFDSLDAFMSFFPQTDEERAMWDQMLIETFHYRPRKVDRLFSGRETIDLGGVIVEAVPTPGHTPGHYSFYFPEQGVLFMADYDLTPFGPYYGDFYSDIDDVIDSVNRLREIPAKIWLTSHEKGMIEAEPGDLWDKYLAVIDTRENKLLDLLKEPRTMEEIIQARIVYGRVREPKEYFDYGERNLMARHLVRLINNGVVAHENDRYFLI